MVLLGRKAELAEIAGLLDRAGSGISGVLVVTGAAGIGKTALLTQAVADAAALQVTTVSGVEAEQDLSFAGLHRLLRPLLGERGRLPSPQRGALETAFGLLPGPAPDLFLVGLATLSLLADAASDRALLAVCDDAQWLDRESLRVLGFVARRLDAEGVVLLFGARRHGTGEELLTGLPALQLDGLADPDAAELLDTELRTRIDGVITAALLPETGGNPLAIVELARRLDEGTPLRPELGNLLPLDRRLEARFLRQVHRLDTAAQDFLLILAANSGGDRNVLRRAAGLLSEATSEALDAALDHARRADLVVLGADSSTTDFRHPLIRSAVYNGATPNRRRRAHAALAAATDPATDSDRRAWHRAAATEEPDEEVAAEVETAADRARERGGYLAQATFLRTAAELSPVAVQRNGRLLAAAGAALTAGAPFLAEQLLDQLVPDLGIAVLDAYAMRLRGFLNVMLGREGAVPLLHDAAMLFADHDTRTARDTLLEAFDAVAVVARIGGDMTARRVAQSALELPHPPGTPTLEDLLLTAHAHLVGDDYTTAVPHMRRALAALLADGAENTDAARWFLLGVLLALELWDIDALGECSRRYAATARRHGTLRILQAATHGLATHALLCGRFTTAAAHYAEFKDIAAAIGADLRYANTSDALLHGWRGDEEPTLAAVAVQAGLDAERPGGLQVQIARHAQITLHLGRCQYAAAQVAATVVFDEDPPHFGGMVLADLIEAAVRNNDTPAAERALVRLTARATASGTPWAMGVLARSRALLAVDSEAEPLYLQALALLEPTPSATEIARTRLLYGEWLRRRRRRRDARNQLRSALELFDAMGAAAFADRAGTELAATGETARERTPDNAYALTARELQIAHLAATGITNQQIAAELFLSTATVEYHLRKIFRKLDITSRRELQHRF